MKITELLTPLILEQIGFEKQPTPRFSQHVFYRLKLDYYKLLVLSTELLIQPIEYIFLGDVNSSQVYPRLKISTIEDLCDCIEKFLESDEYTRESFFNLLNKIKKL